MVEGGIRPGATDLFNLRLRVERDSDACIELLFGERNELRKPVSKHVAPGRGQEDTNMCE